MFTNKVGETDAQSNVWQVVYSIIQFSNLLIDLWTLPQSIKDPLYKHISPHTGGGGYKYLYNQYNLIVNMNYEN